MAKKLSMMINADHPEMCRAVILEDGRVNDYIVENVSQEKIKGNIYLGVINRVEPAIEAAFVDIGGNKFGFLPFKDVLKESYVDTGEKKARVRIQDVLVRGQEILVQVAKESRDAKGPSLTNSISIPGRFLVLMSGSHSSAVSRKIEDEEERKKLKTLVSDFKLPENLGLIIRTAGVGRTKNELQKDLQRLLIVWENLKSSREKADQQLPFLIYQEADMVVRLVRDHFTTETSEVLVDNVESYYAVKNFMKLIMPRMVNRVKLYQDMRPIFSRYNIEDQIESLYQRKVLLPSGGSIVFDTGEAMVCIDVNSGKTTSASQLEETALNTNLEAAVEIGRQLRLRDLGGLVVIDFIDMFHKKNQSLIEKEIKKVCKLDKARINITRISKFGLLEMSRQRLAPPVQQGAFEGCVACDGMGIVRSVNYTVMHVLRKISENLASGKVKELRIEISPEITEYLLNNKCEFLLNLQVKHKFKLEFSSVMGMKWTDFKYNVKEKSEEEIASQDSKVKDINLAKKSVDEDGEKSGYQTKGRIIKGRRGRPTQRKRYSKRSSYTQTSRTKSSQQNSLNSSELPTELPSSQSSKVAKTHQKEVSLNVSQNININKLSSGDNPDKNLSVLSKHNLENKGNTESSLPLTPNPTSKTTDENKDFFKRMAGFFNKTQEKKGPPTSGTES